MGKPEELKGPQSLTTNNYELGRVLLFREMGGYADIRFYVHLLMTITQ